MSNEDGTQVFKGTTSEDVRLENLGYEQGESVLKRRDSEASGMLISFFRAQALLWSA
jgi:hypothetical protein